MIGTTQFVNAFIQPGNGQLCRVFVIRLCGSATAGLPPWSGLPAELVQHIAAGHLLADGGYEYDGSTEICPISSADVATAAEALLQTCAEAAAICGVHSPVNPQHELEFASQLQQHLQQLAPGRVIHLTLSHKLSGRLGLLEREAASILNACLQPLAAAVLPAYQQAVARHSGLSAAPLYLTANDGTLLTAAAARDYPLLTVRSGPVNSVRGAAYLARLTHETALVIDIGGTTTDVGAVHQGQPRMSGSFAEVAGVLTNFQMPDVASIGLGGGSTVKFTGKSQQQQQQQLHCQVGPESVGNALTDVSLVCGGSCFTASDVAVLLHDLMPGLASRQHCQAQQQLKDAAGISSSSSSTSPGRAELQAAWDCIQVRLAAAVDAAKLSPDPIPVVVVGGGAPLCGAQLPGASCVIHPPHGDVANAVGAAIPQVAGVVNTLLQLGPVCREQALAEAVAQATAAAVAAGADPDTCELVEQDAIPVAYGPSGSTRLFVKVVGQLAMGDGSSSNGGSSTDVSRGGMTSEQAVPAEALAAAAAAAGAEAGISSSAQCRMPAAAGTGRGVPHGTCAAAGDDRPVSGSGTSPSGSGSWTTQQLEAYRPSITSSGFWQVSGLDLDAMALGAQVLGAGGGGSARHCRMKLANMMAAAAGDGGKRSHDNDQQQQQQQQQGVLQLLGAAAADRAAARAAAAAAQTWPASSNSSKMPLILSLQDLPDDALLCDVGGMGAPTVSGEKLDSHECSSAVRALSAALPAPVTVLLCAEVGGGNALEPLAVGMELGLPVVDADLMGRAFPELQMSTAACAGVPLTPAAVADDKGNTVVMAAAASPLWAEKVLRAACTEMGCSVGLASSPMQGKQAKQVVVEGSLSLAWRLGMALLAARAAKADPVDAVLQLYKGSAALLLRGKVVDVQRDTRDGFVRGHVRVAPLLGEEQATSDGSTSLSSSRSRGDASNGIVIEFQNEALMARAATGAPGADVLACVPDLICCLESSSGAAVATEDLRYGLQISVVVLPAHPLLRTAAALRVVGPAAFGLGEGVQYEPVGRFPLFEGVHELFAGMR